MRVCFFPGKSAELLVEGPKWLRNYVSRTTRQDLLEVHGDSDTSLTVPGRGQDPSSAIFDEYANSVEPPIAVFR